MTNKQILKQAIEKAVKNGWNKRGCDDVIVESFMASSEYNKLEKAIGLKFSKDERDTNVIYLITPKAKGSRKVELDIMNLLFNHDFAKAFFGTEMRPKVDLHGNPIGSIPIWKIYLQQMVLEEEPLKYIKKFL